MRAKRCITNQSNEFPHFLIENINRLDTLGIVNNSKKLFVFKNLNKFFTLKRTAFSHASTGINRMMSRI